MRITELATRLRDASVVFSGSAPEGRAAGWEEWLAGGATPSASGTTVTYDNATRLVTVYACISLISDSLASATPETYSKGQDGILVPRSNPTWLETPSQDMSRFEFFWQSTSSALIDGNTFWYVARTETGTPQELFVLDPRAVSVELDERTGRRKYAVDGQPLRRDEIIHIPAFVVPGAARGLSPITAAKDAIGLGMSAQEFGARFFANGTTMSGVIEVPGNLEPEQAKVMAQSFQANHQGVRKSHLPGVLTGGSSWRSLSVTPDEAQFLETRKYQTAEIARLYRVPPHLVGDVERSTSWGTGIEEQNRNFIQYTLSPWTMRFETALSSLLPKPQQVKFNMASLLRGTKKERYETYQIGIDAGFITPDEARREEGIDPLPDGMGAKPRLAPNDSPFSEPADETNQDGGTTDESQ